MTTTFASLGNLSLENKSEDIGQSLIESTTGHNSEMKYHLDSTAAALSDSSISRDVNKEYETINRLAEAIDFGQNAIADFYVFHDIADEAVVNGGLDQLGLEMLHGGMVAIHQRLNFTDTQINARLKPISLENHSTTNERLQSTEVALEGIVDSITSFGATLKDMVKQQTGNVDVFITGLFSKTDALEKTFRQMEVLSDAITQTNTDDLTIGQWAEPLYFDGDITYRNILGAGGLDSRLFNNELTKGSNIDYAGVSHLLSLGTKEAVLSEIADTRTTVALPGGFNLVEFGKKNYPLDIVTSGGVGSLKNRQIAPLQPDEIRKLIPMMRASIQHLKLLKNLSKAMGRSLNGMTMKSAAYTQLPEIRFYQTVVNLWMKMTNLHFVKAPKHCMAYLEALAKLCMVSLKHHAKVGDYSSFEGLGKVAMEYVALWTHLVEDDDEKSSLYDELETYPIADSDILTVFLDGVKDVKRANNKNKDRKAKPIRSENELTLFTVKGEFTKENIIQFLKEASDATEKYATLRSKEVFSNRGHFEKKYPAIASEKNGDARAEFYSEIREKIHTSPNQFLKSTYGTPAPNRDIPFIGDYVLAVLPDDKACFEISRVNVKAPSLWRKILIGSKEVPLKTMSLHPGEVDEVLSAVEAAAKVMEKCYDLTQEFYIERKKTDFNSCYFAPVTNFSGYDAEDMLEQLMEFLFLLMVGAVNVCAVSAERIK